MAEHVEWEKLDEIFTKIGAALKKPARLVLIGSSVGMFHGQPSRMTEDIDVWRPSSSMDMGDLRQACEAAGIAFDPKEYDPDRFYLQLVSPGIVHIGKYIHETKMAFYGNLEVLHPPIENIIASKLLRAEPRDIEDAIFLRRKFDVKDEAVVKVIKSFPAEKAEIAMDNMLILSVTAGDDLEGKAPGFH